MVLISRRHVKKITPVVCSQLSNHTLYFISFSCLMVSIVWLHLKLLLVLIDSRKACCTYSLFILPFHISHSSQYPLKGSCYCVVQLCTTWIKISHVNRKVVIYFSTSFWKLKVIKTHKTKQTCFSLISS